jgi:hypothetical protein
VGVVARLRKHAWVFLVAGGIGAAAVFAPHVPHERQIELRLDDAGSVTAVESSWRALPVGQGEPLQGSTWRFAAGKAPPSITTRVSLPNGRYELDLMLERGEERTILHRTITIGDADHITVPLR